MRSTLINRWSITSLIGLVSITLVIIVLSTSYSSLVGNLSSVHASPATWQDDFNGKSLNTNIWSISTGTYGMGAQKNQHQGYFQRDRVSVNSGYLTLRLTQEYGRVGTNPHGIISRGGEISTLKTYGYGTYEWRMRTSSTASSPANTHGKVVSGQISSGFTYVNNSETELDFEVEGQYPNRAEMTTWHNTNPTTDPPDSDSTSSSAMVTGMAKGFKTYKMVWSVGEVKYYIDNTLVADHTTNVPSAPASIFINHWGTDSTDFGGLASVGTTRYLLVDWVRYTAPSSGTGSHPSPSPAVLASIQGCLREKLVLAH